MPKIFNSSRQPKNKRACFQEVTFSATKKMLTSPPTTYYAIVEWVLYYYLFHSLFSTKKIKTI